MNRWNANRWRGCGLALMALAVVAAERLPGAGFEMTRTFDRIVTLTNQPVTVSVTLSNTTGQTLRGVWFSDQVPAGLALRTLSISINGRTVTNALFETGLEGDVLPGCKPCRWVLESPRAFARSNPVPANASLQIRYELVSETPGTFVFPEFSVAGFYPATSNAAFAVSGDADSATLWLLTLTNRFPAVGGWTAAGFRVAADAPTGWCYAVEKSTNLTVWQRLGTNVAPSGVLDADAPRQPQGFYRLVWLP